MTKDPISEFFTNKKNPDICSGPAGYISLDEIFIFSNDKNSRPFNFLFQIARDAGATLSECVFSSKKHTSLKRLFKDVQGFTSKEPGPSLIRQEKPEKQGGLRVQP
jgi:hypothetical protein